MHWQILIFEVYSFKTTYDQTISTVILHNSHAVLSQYAGYSPGFSPFP